MKAFILLLLAVSASANWFSKNTASSSLKEWSEWDQAKLNAWLKEHNIDVPGGYDTITKDQVQKLVEENWYAGQEWTQKQVDELATHFNDVKESTIDSWTESQTLDWLQKQGVVAPPSSPSDRLKQIAYRQYRSYQSASSSLADQVSTAPHVDQRSQASKTISSLLQTPISLASTASQAVQYVVSTTTNYTLDKLDDTKDYIYSSWDDNQLRSYLEDKGVIEPKSQSTRNELLAKMKEVYLSATDPVWRAWSDSCLFNWLHSRGLVRTDAEKKHDALVAAAEKYYYDAQDTVYGSWNESELREWLIDHDIIKSDAQIRKEKLQKLVTDNYATAYDTIWGAWKDSEMRDWLVGHGYLRSEAQVNRDELIKLMNDKYTDVATTTSAYLTWPDARLRAYLRAHGLDDAYLPTTRPGLLHQVRIRWIQTTNRVEALLQKIRDAIAHSMETAEDRLSEVLALLTGTAYGTKEHAKTRAYEGYEYVREKAGEGYERAREKGEDAYEYVKQKVGEGYEYVEEEKGSGGQEYFAQNQEASVAAASESAKSEL